MKRVLALFGFILFMAAQTGCQAGPFLESSQMSGRGLLMDSDPGQNDATGNELAAYDEPLPQPRKRINSIPNRRIPMISRPLGYRRGYQPCNT